MSEKRRPAVGDKVYVGLTVWTIANVQVKNQIVSVSRVPQGMQRGIRQSFYWSAMKWRDEPGVWIVKERRPS